MLGGALLTDVLGYAAACGTTISFVPQVVQVVRTRETKAISLGMYVLFNIGITLWLFYGIAIAQAPVIVANAVTLVLSMTVLAYKLRFR
jgi:MtN3 and saliva related transmembrane protein